MMMTMTAMTPLIMDLPMKKEWHINTKVSFTAYPYPFYKSFFETGVTMLFTLYTGPKNLSKASGGHHRNRHLTDDDLQARDATIQKIPKTSTTALDVPGPNNNTGHILVNGTLSIYR